MSKYGELSRRDGNSKWFLQRTLKEHDRSMDHPWMQMIYKQSFQIRQYAAWLARQHRAFQALEDHAEADELIVVHEERLLRLPALEADLQQLLGGSWREEVAEMVAESPATQAYVKHLEEDAALHPRLLLAHHFLQYNAVLSGGAYLGEMVSEKLCLPHGAPGVQFYAFEGVGPKKGPARVQQYMKDFDMIELDDETRDQMLVAMHRVYEDTEAMMEECYKINPGPGRSYGSAKASVGGETEAGPPQLIPEDQLLRLTLSELHGYTGADEGRILFSLAGELLDVSAGRELYGPGGSYGLLAGRDATRCLATMSLEPSGLDDLTWKPSSKEDEEALAQWCEKLKAKYPVAGTLDVEASLTNGPFPDADGLRQRAAAAAAAPAEAKKEPAKAKVDTSAGGDKCPISGKEGAGCPMAFMGIGAKSSPDPAPATGSSAPAPAAPKTGFMAGKSMVAAVQSTTSNDSILYKICPLHWDAQTTNLLVLVAAVSWISGIFIGWNLHKQLMN